MKLQAGYHPLLSYNNRYWKSPVVNCLLDGEAHTMCKNMMHSEPRPTTVSRLSSYMKTIIAFLLASLLVGPVCAGQRLADIQPGFSCDGIPQVEKRLGSVELAAQDANGISKYTGIQGGEEVTVVYHCDHGRLTEQEIIFTSATQSRAYQIANEQRKELAKNLGEPIHDGLNLGAWRKLMFGILGADLDYLTSVVVWGRAKEDVMLLVRETEDKRWEVTISQGSSKTEYILNS